jgi:hypothetical protein
MMTTSNHIIEIKTFLMGYVVCHGPFAGPFFYPQAKKWPVDGL